MGGDLHPFTAYFGGTKLEAEADAIIGQGAHDIAKAAEFEVIAHAYDTGRLAEGFIVTRIKSLSWRIINIVHYASFVHDGTTKMRARPFFQWAFDSRAGETVARLGALLNGGSGGGRMSIQQASDMLDGGL